MKKISKTILCFGANSFLAQAFFHAYSDHYNILKVFRERNNGLYFDFENENDIERFVLEIKEKIDGIIFFQGINPSLGLKDINIKHFSKMININLIIPTMLIKALLPKLNENSSVIFFSSIAKEKGSYDPSYAAAKSGLTGLVHSLANACPNIRFNTLSLGLVEGSPVHQKMTSDFVKRHTDRMFLGNLIRKEDVVRVISEVLINNSINRSDLSLEGGFI